jgi:hypothetical protein
VEDEPAAGGGGVEGLAQGAEADAAAAQLRDDSDQVLEGAGEPVEAGDDEGVAGAEVVQAGGQPGPVGGLARLLVREHADAPGVGEGAGLPVEGLPGGRHPGVADAGAGQLDRLGGQLVGQADKVGSWCRGHSRIVRTEKGSWPVVEHPDFPTRFFDSQQAAPTAARPTR